MRCRRALKRMGPFIDGELAAAEAEALREHLDSCEACSRRCALMRGMIREMASLPAIVPTPEESYALINRLRREMAAPAAPAPALRRPRLAAAALTLLVVATVAGVGLTVWSAGGPAPIAEEAALDSGGGEARRDAAPSGAEAVDGEARPSREAAAPTARPALISSGGDYAVADLQDFRNDLGTRLDFYSAYWRPEAGARMHPSALTRLQDDLAADLAGQAAAAGQDPAPLERAVATVLERAGGEPVLPCYAELARVEGAEAWLISASGPEDWLLFPDRKKPSAMALAALGGAASVKMGETALRELAAWLAPSGNGGIPPLAGQVPKGERAAEAGDAAQEAEMEPETGVMGTSPADEPERRTEDFPTFLRRLAAQGTSLDIISALKNLNYEQMLLLVQGNWAALAADSVNLSDFLAPPQRLWAVGCESGEILWGAGR